MSQITLQAIAPATLNTANMCQGMRDAPIAIGPTVRNPYRNRTAMTATPA